SRACLSMRSSGSNTGATTPPAWPRWRAESSCAGGPRASCATSKPGSRASRRPAPSASGTPPGRPPARPAKATPTPTPPTPPPHATGRLAVVHNGIIENFRELREELEKAGAKFGSETDTEVVAHLVTREMKNGRSPADAVAAALPRLRGAFALAFLFAGENDL